MRYPSCSRRRTFRAVPRVARAGRSFRQHAGGRCSGFVDDEVRHQLYAMWLTGPALGWKISTTRRFGRARDRLPSVFPDRIMRWFQE